MKEWIKRKEEPFNTNIFGQKTEKERNQSNKGTSDQVSESYQRNEQIKGKTRSMGRTFQMDFSKTLEHFSNGRGLYFYQTLKLISVSTHG